MIQTTQYVSTNDKLKEQSKLNTLIDNQSILSSNYNSIVNNIKARYESGSVVAPKYRIRGFWDIPDSKISSSSGEQKIIKFKIRYRYLSEYGNANKEEEFTYTSGNTSVTGRFSNWNEIETKLRGRVKTSSGWEWEKIDTSNPDVVNINQLDIPINPGEQVEIQVKSVSEAGWPSNPLESDWSDPIVVAFSDFAELEADDLSELISQNRVDAAVANVTKMFSGNAAHMSSSFYTNDKYFAHTAESITSGFLSPEQTPITLYDKLQDLQNQITMIIEQINSTVGDIIVTLFDNADEQKIYTLSEGETTYINAGDYVSATKNLEEDQKKGAIVTKTFYLDISSDAQSGLFLFSKLGGNRFSMCPSTVDMQKVVKEDGNADRNAYDDYDNVINPSTTSNTYYKEQGRYDLVPINLTNPEVIDFQIGSPSMYQSAQCRGQFVYSRFRNIGDTFNMYANKSSVLGKPDFDENASFTDSENTYDISDDTVDIAKKQIEIYNQLTGSNVKDDVTNLEGIEKIIYRLPKTWKKPDSASVKNLKNDRTLVRINNLTNIDAVAKSMTRVSARLSKLSNENSSLFTIIPKIQSAYGFADLGKIYEDKLIVFDNKDENGTTYITTHKIGYEDRDKLATGPNSCNSYLFLSPVNHSEIQVNGDTLDSTKSLKGNESLRVPIIYQFRMTDANGHIFGDRLIGDDETKAIVKNTKYANIIGIDIWTDRSALKPKQYDIIVYSTYGSTLETNTNRTKTSSTQTLVSTANNIATRIRDLKVDNKTVTRRGKVGSTLVERDLLLK